MIKAMFSDAKFFDQSDAVLTVSPVVSCRLAKYGPITRQYGKIWNLGVIGCGKSSIGVVFVRLDLQIDVVDFDVGDGVGMTQERQSKQRHLEFRCGANQEWRQWLAVISSIGSEWEASS